MMEGFTPNKYLLTGLTILAVISLITWQHRKGNPSYSYREPLPQPAPHDRVVKINNHTQEELIPAIYELVPGKGPLSFIPKPTWKCQDLFTKAEKTVSPFGHSDVKLLQSQFRERLKSFKVTEGFSAMLQEQYMTYNRIVNLPFMQTVCETGFNAGHSAFMWLAANPNIKLYSFDMGSHDYAKPMAEFMANTFPGRFHVTWGDSTKTLPDFRKANPNVRCDLAIVDGGHIRKVAQSDFDNFIHMVNHNNIVVFDDYPSPMFGFDKLGVVWEGERQKKHIEELFKCTYHPEKRRGFAVGRFIV